MTDRLKCLIPTISCPETLNGKEGRYELAAFYCELLGMKIVNEGWLLIAEPADDNKLYFAIDGDGWADERPPRWPDPEYPQQMHLDILVPDVTSAADRVTGMGATLLQDNGTFRIFADPVGHPFCLYQDSTTAKPVVGRLVFDCISPRHLASFYEGFLGARGRVEDSPERVVVDLGDEKLPHLAFQHAQFRAARWPDPAYPAQLHVDYRWHDGLTARAALERAESLGAVRLPDLADTAIYADPASHPFCIEGEIPVAFDVAGLYLNPPEYAVVYCVDGTSPVSVPTLSQPVVPMLTNMTGLTERSTDDATRNGVAGLLAALGAEDATTIGSPDRTAEFTRFLTAIDSQVPPGLEVNLICDWGDTYNTPAIQSWLADHPRFQVHRNPPDVLWTEQVERWLGYLANDLDRRGDHTHAQALESTIATWAQNWTIESKSLVWTKTTDQILESLRRIVTQAGGARG